MNWQQDLNTRLQELVEQNNPAAIVPELEEIRTALIDLLEDVTDILIAQQVFRDNPDLFDKLGLHVETLQQLQKQHTDLTREVTELDLEIQCLQVARDQKRTVLKRLQKKLAAMTTKKPIKLSDHALLRYLERTGQVNVEQLKQELLSPQVQTMVDTLGGTGKFPLGPGHLIMENYTAVTYILAD